MSNALQTALTEGVAALNLDVSAEQQQQLLTYLTLLQRWNQTYNLSGIKTVPEMLTKHLFDCLAVLPFVDDGPMLDIGTGAGLPGIVLAIVHPNQPIDLLDSRRKKTIFLQHICAELGLTHTRVICQRVESYQPDTAYRTLICRAVGTLAEVLHNVDHLWCNNTQFLAMKGQYPAVEITELDPTFHVTCERLEIPGNIGERHLVIVDRPR
ncbi:MAG: 16S rRNA (guanine(527)-N(7))-methyltransferase RsmG [Legionellales bacterium]|nr:16S rRNA (guanine(527)-N(7))-methyltransferase RsmG [Legionellales bacterium]